MSEKSLIQNEKHWFSVWCKPRQEAVAEENLKRQGFHVYLPRIQTRRRRHARWVDVVEALFPRYLFIQVDPVRCSAASVRSTRGVVGLVRFGHEPAMVPQSVIAALRQREDGVSGLHRDDRSLFSVGDSVTLLDGPLAGMEGIYSEEKGEKRALVLLELLGRTHAIRVTRDSVVRAA